MTTATELAARRQSLFAKTTTAAMVLALRTLDAITEPTEEQSMARAWTIEELERRYPEASAAVEKAFDDAAITEAACAPNPTIVEVDYVAVLLAAIPEVK